MMPELPPSGENNKEELIAWGVVDVLRQENVVSKLEALVRIAEEKES